jgi:1-acyl-sn-glycerol-3-phosphate acyltransferase
MTAYVRSSFRVCVVGPGSLAVPRGAIVSATHRSDHDVPVLCSALYVEGGLWRSRVWPHFASRDDLFERGALAALAPALPAPVARLLWRFQPARGLGRVRVHPFRTAEAARLVQALRSVPRDTSLAEVLPAELVAALAARAAARGLPAPATAGEADRLELADVLWRLVGPEDLDAPLLADFWRRRGRAAVGDMRRLVELVRAGEALLLFPEGRISPDGAVGPLRRGFRALVRHAGSPPVLPVGIAYDRLTTGRPRVLVGVGRARTLPADDEEREVLGAMRAVVPLTCVQVVARVLLGRAAAGERTVAPAALDRAVAEEVGRASGEGRPVDPALATARARRGRLADALRAAAERGLVRLLGRDLIELSAGQVAGDALLRHAAAEHGSAREPA